ncbi:Mobile element protein [Candidatus Enterovibrio escicola]|uniref:Mobile element protein n=1 Tax=Candidatus Enterovibrio escicola TaxID=1927127 RepID=A0A2A5T699_9GAMM|nr:Mobile element protein [Candidatus Enterovibrio escacola]
MDENAVLPILLNPLRRKIQQVNADGAYDTQVCHHVPKNKGISPVFHLEATWGTERKGMLEMKL